MRGALLWSALIAATRLAAGSVIGMTTQYSQADNDIEKRWNLLRPLAELVQPPNINESDRANGYDLSQTISLWFRTEGSAEVKIMVEAADSRTRFIQADAFLDTMRHAVCSPGSVKLTFNNQAQFDRIKQSWSSSVEAEDIDLVLVTNTRYCDGSSTDQDDVQPWQVNNITYDDTKHVAMLHAVRKDPKQMFKKWRLVASNTGLTAQADADVAATRRSVSGQIPLDTDFSGKGLSFGKNGKLFPPLVGDVLADIRCDPCFTHGELDYEIDVQPFEDGIFSGHVSLKARGVGASITGKAAMYESLKELFKQDSPIFATALPYAGFYVKGLVDIGVTLKLDLSTVLGNNDKPTALSLGFNVSIPDDSGFTLDFADASKNDESGWTPQFTALEPGMTEDLDLYARVGPKLILEFSANVLGQGAAAGFQFAGGDLDIHAKGVQGKGACGVSTATRGVELDIDLDTSLKAVADVEVLGNSDAATKTIAATSLDIYSGCKTVNSASKLQRPTSMPTTSVADFVPEGFDADVMMSIRSKADQFRSKFASATDRIGDEFETITSVMVSGVSEAAATASSLATVAASTVSEGIESAQDIAASATDEIESGFSQATDVLGDIFD